VNYQKPKPKPKTALGAWSHTDDMLPYQLHVVLAKSREAPPTPSWAYSSTHFINQGGPNLDGSIGMRPLSALR
jgi:hypothetical protein